MNKLYLLSEYVGNYICFRVMIQDEDNNNFGIIAQKNINSSEELYGCDKLVYHCHHLTYLDNRKLQFIADNFRKLNNKFNHQYEKAWNPNSFLNAAMSLLIVAECEKTIYCMFAGKEKELSLQQLIETKGDWNLINSLIREGN